MEITFKYGYTIGQDVTLNVGVKDEYGNTVPKGTVMRIVAISPKTVLTPKQLVSDTRDTKEYFYNAVKLSDVEKSYPRIRQHFVTLQ